MMVNILSIDEISLGPSRKLMRRTVTLLTFLFKAHFPLQYALSCFRMMQINMIQKPNNSAEKVIKDQYQCQLLLLRYLYYIYYTDTSC